ncbi:K02A2.6-like [Cordylochernes scorpioides]|uniref:RNA-directed DNA polymerase n=1 Tax=Cordylochernes scorpioides TaxID=51811 RepID=A0ABY6LV85_9ARAC|nr:K02A2.6-like [Cordylochernes scorpioides]
MFTRANSTRGTGHDNHASAEKTGPASTPVKQLPRRLPMTRRDEVAKLIEEMAEQDVIEPSSSPWASPVVLVKKKDGSTRFCVDYRRLNDLTKKDSYPLPRIDATLDTLSGSQWFSTLDLKSGYWQVSIHPEDREKTAFTTGNGLWQFKVMPFGLCNAPATFERLMETVLQGIPLETCLVYLDDIIVMGKSFEEHLINLERVLQKIRGARLKLNPRKCKPFKEKTELRLFGNGLYYRIFVPGFSNIARPLHRLTESGRLFSWTIDCERAMDKLKQALSSPPMLAYPDPGEPFILDTDASNTGIGAVLSQTQDGVERVIAYFSKTLSKPERNYCVTRRELLAIVKSIEHFHHYLYGQKFLLRTNHAALRWLLNFKSPEGQLARWIQRLQEYDMEIQHRKGKSHGNADALSRRPCPVNCKHCSKAETQAELNIRQLSLAEELKLDEWSPEEMRKSQFEDADLRPVMNWLNAGTNRPAWEDVASCSPITKSYWSLWDSLEFRGGVLYRKWESDDGQHIEWKMILPQSRVPSVLKELHNSPSGGHFGIAKTLGRVKERFYWAGCRASVEKWVRQCTECASRKEPKTRSRARLKTYNVGAPVERIAIDIMGPLPRRSTLTKGEISSRDFLPKCVNFSEAIKQGLLPYTPSPTACQLPILLMAYRSSVHETTGYSPAKMLFRRELKLPCDLIFGCPNSIGEGANEFVDRLHSRLEKVHRWAREKLEIASEAMKVRYDTHACGNDLQEGGLVWLYNPKRKKGLSPKLQKSWEGPFRIVKKLNDVLAGSSWGSDANTLRTSALALIFSTAEYCAPVWEGSCHTKLIDTQLNSTLRIITGVCQPTRIDWLPVLAHISPPELRRKEATKKMYQKLLDSPDLEINPILQSPPKHRLKSRKPIWSRENQLLSQNFNISEAWTNSWISSDIPNKNLITSPSVKIPGFSLPRREWVLLNRFRTGQGRCAELMKLWGYTKDPNCACNVPQSMSHILDDCPLYKFNGGISNLHSVTPEALNWLKALPLRL